MTDPLTLSGMEGTAHCAARVRFFTRKTPRRGPLHHRGPDVQDRYFFHIPGKLWGRERQILQSPRRRGRRALVREHAVRGVLAQLAVALPLGLGEELVDGRLVREGRAERRLVRGD